MIEEFRSPINFFQHFTKLRFLQSQQVKSTRWKCQLSHQSCSVAISGAYLVVVRTISGLLYASVLFLVPHLYTNHWVHVEPGQLPRLYHCDTHLKITSKIQNYFILCTNFLLLARSICEIQECHPVMNCHSKTYSILTYQINEIYFNMIVSYKLK